MASRPTYDESYGYQQQEIYTAPLFNTSKDKKRNFSYIVDLNSAYKIHEYQKQRYYSARHKKSVKHTVASNLSIIKIYTMA